MSPNKQQHEDPLTARLGREGRDERPAFDEQLHERIVRAVPHEGLLPPKATPVSVTGGPVRMAMAASLLLAVLLSVIISATVGRAGRHTAGPDQPMIAWLEPAPTDDLGQLAVVLAGAVGDVTLAEEGQRLAADWSAAEEQTRTAFDLFNRFAVQLVLARDE